MEEQLKMKTEESIKKILDEGITTNNLDHLYKLSKINKIAKEGENNMYENYGRYDRDGRYGHDEYGRDEYGRYDGYGARRRDNRGRYMGHEHLDKMYDDYSRYMDSRERYGAGSEDSKKSLKYMLESMEDFAKMLRKDASSQEEIMMIKQTAQRIANM